jgi:hypothetical protein
MSDASTFPDSLRRRVARVLGVLALLVVQGGCGVVLTGLFRLQRFQHDMEAAEPPAAKHADVARTRATAMMFPAATGAINWFGDDTVVVMTVTNERVRVRVDPETLYLRLHEDGAASPSDLYPGADIVVSGNPDPDGTILAQVVLVGKP